MYLCIDLKSFFAAVECAERGLDLMTTNLVVADPERSKGTICLAVTPAMKKLGIKNRCRIYEIPKDIEYITAPPRMQLYIDYAAEIYGIYLEYIAPEDIHVYSIDEAFLDIAPYQPFYHKSAEELALLLTGEVRRRLGLISTCGIGTNLYLAKVAMDILAKHSKTFLGELTEESFREKLWDHEPLTDFWQIGSGKARHLMRLGIVNQRGIALADEEMLYREFGIDAELMIDHAWGKESTTMADIKRYKPKSRSFSSFQVLLRDYTKEEARLIVKEMADNLCLSMVEKGAVADQFYLYIGYSHKVSCPPVNAAVRLPRRTSADTLVIPALIQVFDRNVLKDLPIRHVGVVAGELTEDTDTYQLDLFDPDLTLSLEKNKRIQKAVLEIKYKYGKNAILKEMSYQSAGTARERNHMIGGHKSGT